MERTSNLNRFASAVGSGDVARAKEILDRDPNILVGSPLSLFDFLLEAVDNDDAAMFSLLAENGADIHQPVDDFGPEGVIERAASKGATRVVSWLLNHGVQLNSEVRGTTRCMPLTLAVIDGHFEVVKLLVERGADFNAVWDDKNALTFAIMYGHKEIEEFLRSKGALEPRQLRGEAGPAKGAGDAESEFLEHLRQHHGEPEALALREIVPGEPSIAIHVVPIDEHAKLLVTHRMSARPMTTPAGEEDYRFAEAQILLPADWPLDAKALADPRNFWPIEWLRRVARYPHDHRTWLGGKVAVFANDEPPKPLAPDTKLTCVLAIASPGPDGVWKRSDGSHVLFYELHPLYTEERDLEKRRGVAELLQRFQTHGVGQVVDVKRKNVGRRA